MSAKKEIANLYNENRDLKLLVEEMKLELSNKRQMCAMLLNDISKAKTLKEFKPLQAWAKEVLGH